MAKKRVLVFQFHQETDTFNPIPTTMEDFRDFRLSEGEEAYRECKELPCSFHGMIDAIEEEGGEVIPTIHMRANPRGRVDDEVFDLLMDRVTDYIAKAGKIDAICADLHGEGAPIGTDQRVIGCTHTIWNR